MVSNVEGSVHFEAVLAAGNVAVVTGAAMGIGRALVLSLLDRGLRVVAIDENARALTALEQSASGNLTCKLMDVADMQSWTALADEVGPISVLVNNAASRTGRGFDAPIEEWQRAMDVNLWAAIFAVQAFLPAMQTGAIVNVGSKQGITNPPGHPVYNMTKAALRTYSEQLEHELRQSDQQSVKVHFLVPGWTTTGTAEHKPGAWLPEQVVARLLDGMAAGAFYIICPDDEVTEEMDRARILWAAADITEGRPPLSRWDKDWQSFAKEALES